jgi:membrane fusion protein, copper/silver efflux system
MNTNWIWSAVLALALGATFFAVTGCNKEDRSGHAHQYTCKHHPEVVQDTPGNCPKCGMKLVEKH